MCTRFYIEPESEELSEIIEQARKTLLAKRFLHAGGALLTSGEIRPTNVVSVIAPNKDGKASVFPMRWGYRIPGASLIVNARSETASAKPTFRDDWKVHRCVIPASWYFEWEHFKNAAGQTKTGDRYSIQPAGASATWLCGLYRMEEQFPVFAVLTREPTEDLRKIHDRMPLILPKDMIRSWIDPKNKPEELLPYALNDMVFEKSS